MKYRYPQSGVLDGTERIEDPLSYMEKLADSILPLKEFGFSISARFIMATSNPTVVYDSEWCRIAFGWERWEYIAEIQWTSLMAGCMHQTALQQ
jgi:hypothetical protein